MMHIMHVIPGLDIGGAETMLLQLVRALTTPRFKHTVLNMQRDGRLGPVLEAAGARVVALGMPKGRPNLGGMMRLVRAAYREPVDVLHGWMYHGNLGAQALHNILRPVPPVVWSIHTTVPEKMNAISHTVVRSNALLSGRSAAVVYVARSTMQSHERIGFDNAHAVHIPGGIDTTTFASDSQGAAALRVRLGLAPETPLVGLIARLHPMKDHANFLAAARALDDTSVHFVLVGEGLSDAPQTLRPHIDARIQARLHWMGPQSQVHKVLQGLNVCTLSSQSEALPRILLEAMACQTPCVATDVGDCADVLREVGWIVPPKDPTALAQAWQAALRSQSTDARFAQGHQRVIDTYSTQRMGEQYAALYERLRA